MKRLIAAAAALTIALTMAGCSDKGSEDNASSTAAEQSQAAETESQSDEEPEDDTQIRECLKAQLQAAADKDYDAFSEAMNAALMIEILTDSGDASAEIPPERAEEMTREAYDRISAAVADGFDGELAELKVKGEDNGKGAVLYLSTFKINNSSCYATIYTKDGRWGSYIETEDLLQDKVTSTMKVAANQNAKALLNCAEKVIGEYGNIPDSEYRFDVESLVVTDNPDSALEAFKSAVAEKFTRSGDQEELDKGEIYMLVKNGKPYIQWRSLANPDAVGEAPGSDSDDFSPVWGSPVTE